MGILVGQYIRSARESFGLDLAEVAYKLGLSEADFERIEKGIHTGSHLQTLKQP